MAVTDEQRDQIIALAREGKGRNQIARHLKITGRVVSEICKEAGLTFDRAPEVATATAVRAADAAKKRADAEAAELDILRLQQTTLLAVLRKEPGATVKAIMRGEGGAEHVEEIDFLPSADLRNLAQAREKSVTMITNLALANADTGVTQAKSMLTGMMDALKVVWSENEKRPPEGGTSEGLPDQPGER